jgi:hypothetical protein
MSITIEDEISGKPVVIERPLLAEHIKVDQLLWYNGFTSTGRWNCPAIITQVNTNKKQFRVRSLDDMVEQDQWYEFDTSKGSSGSRKTMRLVEPSEVKAYLEKRRLALQQNVEFAKTDLQSAEEVLKRFDDILAVQNL